MKDIINWGIVSTGEMAGNMTKAFGAQEECRALAVCSRDGDRAAAFAAEHGIPRHYEGLESMAADPDIDVVYIASPLPEHHRHILTALDAGKNVVCEKPMTESAAQARECARIASDKRLFLMEGLWMRFFPAMADLRRRIADGFLGSIRYVGADFCIHVTDPGHRLLDRRQGGGALMDLGVYPLSLAQMVLGRLEGAMGFTEFGGNGVDVAGAYSLRAEGGGVGGMTCGLVGYRPREATVTGTRGTARIHNIFFRPDSITYRYGEAGETTEHYPYLGNGYAHEILHVAECLRNGLVESPVMPLEQTVNVLDITDRIRRRWPERDESQGGS